jgi:hypothetical protein
VLAVPHILLDPLLAVLRNLAETQEATEALSPRMKSVGGTQLWIYGVVTKDSSSLILSCSGDIGG